MIEIDTERLAKIKTLYKGAHDPNGEMCVMEAVAYIAREKWSDHPACVSPVIAAFARNWNDSLPDDLRDEYLKPLISKFVGTIGSDALETRRATMAADWLVRVHTPAWLRLAGLTNHADALANFPEITNFAKTPALMPVLQAARKDAAAAGDAAGDAARAAARAAAGDAARAAAGDAAGAAARADARAAAGDAAGDAARAAARAAAGAAARAAAGAAAWDAAGDAAGDAARAKLAPILKELQLSALDLLTRMIEAKD